MPTFLWIWRILSPIVFFVGLYYFVSDETDEYGFIAMLILGGVFFIGGIILGLKGWLSTVPPNWFWRKSKVDLAGNRITTSLGYGLQFFFLPAAIAQLIRICIN
jgi:hypothetical protein